MLLLAGAEILRGNIDDTVGIDVELDFDLRDAARCRSNAVQTELSERLVVTCEFTLTLYDVDVYRGLIISCSGEYLLCSRRDSGVSLDQRGSYTAKCLDAESKRSDIQKEDIACIFIAGDRAPVSLGCLEFGRVRFRSRKGRRSGRGGVGRAMPCVLVAYRLALRSRIAVVDC